MAATEPGSPKARSSIESRRLAHFSLAAVLSIAGLAAIVLYRFSPATYNFYPICPVHEYLHLLCPGCGTTRALAALMHGNFREGLQLNALTIGLVLPAAVVYGFFSYQRAVRSGAAFRWPQIPGPAIYAGTGALLAFTVLRNL